MILNAELLMDELKTLRRGRGVLERGIAGRLGSQTRILCGIEKQDDEATVRDKIARAIVNLCKRLPKDLQLSVLAALALHPDAQHRVLRERREWLAERLEYDDRTVRRRIDDGLALV